MTQKKRDVHRLAVVALTLTVTLIVSGRTFGAAEPLCRWSFDTWEYDPYYIGIPGPTWYAPDLGSGAPINMNLMKWASSVAESPSGEGRSLNLNADPPEASYAFAEGAYHGSAKIEGLTAFTLTLWINVRDASGFFELPDKRILGDYAQGEGFYLSFGPKQLGHTVTPDHFRLRLNVDQISVYSDYTGGANQEWKFIAATYSSDATTSWGAFYEGAVHQAATELTGPQTFSLNRGPTDNLGFPPLRIGSENTVENYKLASWIDDVRIYGSALSLGEIEAIRVAGVPEPATMGLLAASSVVLLCRRRPSPRTP